MRSLVLHSGHAMNWVFCMPRALAAASGLRHVVMEGDLATVEVDLAGGETRLVG